ncbi:probable deoxyhypusine synthase [Phymastichus coffea]|uniref:probable deoxyhypusine synthase n=1 Tax=Phymastichus coffea TaxID=108790 RepID=UPI00273CC97A|nr:probable deoxyhypusine synthase [Phymastichus coffea]
MLNNFYYKMKMQSSPKKNNVKGKKDVSAVNLKSEDCDISQLKKNSGSKCVLEIGGKNQESSKIRNQKKSKRSIKNAEIEGNKTSVAKMELTRNISRNTSELFFINNVLKRSIPLPLTIPSVRGYDFNSSVDYSSILSSYKYSGFQATNFGLAVEEILRMLVARRVPLERGQEDTLEMDEFIKRRHSCTIFLGFTAEEMLSKGVRETVRFLAEHRMIDCIITTTRTIEEDLLECLTSISSQNIYGKTDKKGSSINIAESSIITNTTYSQFKDWIIPILDKMLEEQKKGVLWTTSKIITRLGEEINNVNSIYYWAAKNKIPVFSPALAADGNLGKMMYFHSCKNPGLVIDILSDLKRINTLAIKAVTSGMIVIGGGIVKHHALSANFMRYGADFGVFVNAVPEYDGSDSGARPDEAVSWGKIKKDSKAVKIHAEASLIFPLLVAETFIRHFVSYKMRIVTSV